MKKRTNKILLITLGILFVINLVVLFTYIHKYNQSVKESTVSVFPTEQTISTSNHFNY